MSENAGVVPEYSVSVSVRSWSYQLLQNERQVFVPIGGVEAELSMYAW